MLYVKQSGGGSMFTLTITTDTGATVTIQKGTETPQSQVATNGTVTFEGLEAGTWHAVSSLNGVESSDDIELIDTYELNLPTGNVFGIRRELTTSSPQWERTDDSINFEYQASVGTTEGHSSFDGYAPYKDIVRENLDENHVMVKIPKFWYKRYRDETYEYIKICNAPRESFNLHPAFMHNGAEQDYIQIGAYKTTSNTQSKAGELPTTQVTRAQARANAISLNDTLGGSWGIEDVTVQSAIQMLILVEIATYDVQQAIGQGLVNSNQNVTGTADSVPNLNGSSANGEVVWRGIEGLWGNFNEYIDGLNFNGSSRSYYVCNDQTKYADDTATNYELVSYNATGITTNAQYISKLGYDENNPWFMQATECLGGSMSTYITDTYYFTSGGWGVYATSGDGGSRFSAGLWYTSLDGTSGVAYNNTYRLLRIPN